MDAAHSRDRAPEASPGRSGAGRGPAWLIDFALIAIFAVALRLPALSISVFNIPSAWDEGAFILAAHEVVRGHLPYLTFWDHKPLGSTMIIAAVMSVLGQSLEVARDLALASVIVTAGSLYAIALRVLSDRLTALASALLYVAFSTQLGGIQLMTESLQAVFATGGVLLLLSVPGRRSASGLLLTFAAAGLAFGIATWIKYVPAVPATLVGGFVLITLLRRPGGQVGRTLALGSVFAAGLLLPTLAGAALYWWNGILDEFLYANFGFAKRYIEHAEHPRGALVDRVRDASLALVQIWPLVVVAAAAFLPGPLRRLSEPERRWGSAVIGLWLVGELAALALQTKFYDHHFLSVLPPLCLAAAAALRFHASAFAIRQRATAAFALATAFVISIPLAHHVFDTAVARFRPDVPREVARALKERMAPGDQVYVANYAPIIYFLADAPLPTRYAFPGFLVGPRVLVDDIPAERRRVLDSRPKYIVLNEAWRYNLAAWDERASSQVEETLAQHYAPQAAWTLPDARGTVRLFAPRG